MLPHAPLIAIANTHLSPHRALRRRNQAVDRGAPQTPPHRYRSSQCPCTGTCQDREKRNEERGGKGLDGEGRKNGGGLHVECDGELSFREVVSREGSLGSSEGEVVVRDVVSRERGARAPKMEVRVHHIHGSHSCSRTPVERRKTRGGEKRGDQIFNT